MLKRFSNKVIPFSIVIVLVDTLIGSIEMDGHPLSGWDFIGVRIVACLLGIYLIKKLALWSSAGFRKDGFCKGVFLGIPLIALGFASGVISNIEQWSDYSFLGYSSLLFFTVGMFFVGLAEEIVYRGLLLNNMLDKWGTTQRGCWKSIFVSAAIFGIAHLPNLFFSPILTVLFQAINAAAGGVLFSVIYIKTKNIWSVIAVHALVDWLALLMMWRETYPHGIIIQGHSCVS